MSLSVKAVPQKRCIRGNICDHCGMRSVDGAQGDVDSEFANLWFCRDCWQCWNERHWEELEVVESQLHVALGSNIVERWQLSDGGFPTIPESSSASDWSRPVLLSTRSNKAGAHWRLAHQFMKGLCDLSFAFDMEYTASGQWDVGPLSALLYLACLGHEVLGFSEDALSGVSFPHPAWIPPPTALGEDLMEMLPAALCPRHEQSLLVQGSGSVTLLRRDAQAWYGWDFLIEGSRRWWMYPPSTPLETLNAVEGDLGAGVARNDDMIEALCYEAVQHAGETMLVPPGWWYQTMAEVPSISVLGQQLPIHAIPWITRALLKDGYRIEKNQCDRKVLLSALRDAFHNRPPGDRPRRTSVQSYSGCCFQSGCETLSNKHFSKRLDELLFNECWTFVSNGICIPEDAPLWSAQDLARFLRWGGFIRPAVRIAVSPRSCSCLEQFLLTNKHLEFPSSSVSLVSTFPRVIWSYWAQGANNLPRFRQICALSWIMQNPGWRFMLLDASTVFGYIRRSDLPEHWEKLGPEHAADAVRLALLVRHGGVWTDVGNLCLRALDTWVWKPVTLGFGFVAFYFARHGKIPGRSKEYVENWFLASQRNHVFMVEWHKLFLLAWSGKHTSETVADDPLFQDVELSHLDSNQRRYLTMHVCFKKLIDERGDMHNIWANEMLLLRADDGVLRWMAGIGTREEAVRTWVYAFEKSWVDSLVADAPFIKFIGKFARALDIQPVQHLLQRENNIQRLLLHAFAPVREDCSCGVPNVSELESCVRRVAEYDIVD